MYSGQSGVTYGLMTSSPIIKKTSQSELTPTYVDFTAYYTVGKDITKYYLNGRFVIEEVLNDDGVWRTVYTSTQDESEVRRSLYTVLTTKDGKVPVSKDGKYAFGYPRNVTSIRCRFYAAGGTTQLLGEQTCAVVADATAQLSQSDIVEILSDGGRWNGLYYKNGKLYISFSAALGGELTLGGKGNGNGKLAIRNDTGKQIGYVDNTGVHFNQGEFSGLFAGELSSPLGNIGGWKISNNPKCIYSGDAPGDAGITLYSSGRMKIQYIDETAGVIEAETTLDVIDGRIHTYQQTLVSAILTDCDLSNPTRLLNPPTVSSGGHIVFAADGMTLAYLGSSSKRYKNHVKDISDEDVQKLFDIPVVYFKYKPGYLEDDDSKVDTPIPGFYAEDMEQAFPDAVRYENGKVEDWNYRTLIPAMEKQIQILYKQNQELMKAIKELKEAQNNGNKL